MNKKIIIKAAVILLWTVSLPVADWASQCPKSSDTEQPVEEKVNTVDTVLKQLNKKALELTSYEAQIEYGFIQPLLFGSETIRKGTLYYGRFDKKSKLRINFETLKQEDEEEGKYSIQYIVLDGASLTLAGHQFQGSWLVHIDYEIESVKYYQLDEAKEPNKPVDAFDLASRNLPMIGFTKIEDLKKQFQITLVEQKKSEAEDFIQLHLKVKPNSVYKDDYVYIDFWIDKKLGLPAKVFAVSTEPATESVEQKDIYEIKFIKPKVNRKIDGKVFEFKIPEGFGEPEIIPLKKKGERK